MMQLDVVVLDLDFACCYCEHSVGVTLKCEGKGLVDNGAAAWAAVACPSCTAVNSVYFEPHSGRLCGVELYRLPRGVPEPSVN